MRRRRLVYSPRAQRDLLALQKRFTRQILDDLVVLEAPPWPPGKVKRLRGCDFWEIRTGDYRTIFWPSGREVVILRVVNRRDLEKAIGRIDIGALVRWLRERFGR